MLSEKIVNGNAEHLYRLYFAPAITDLHCCVGSDALESDKKFLIFGLLQALVELRDSDGQAFSLDDIQDYLLNPGRLCEFSASLRAKQMSHLATSVLYGILMKIGWGKDCDAVRQCKSFYTGYGEFAAYFGIVMYFIRKKIENDGRFATPGK
jgi:hypothetical protein